MSGPGCPGAAACGARRPGCGHLSMLESWRDAWTAWEQQMEREVPGMYAHEVADWRREHPAPLLKDWMRHYRQR